MKILIIGCVASGKTSLAKRLSKLLDISYFEIDSIVHDDVNNYKRTPEEQRKIIEEINVRENSWILEGTLRRNLFYLLDLADRVIYLDIDVRIRKMRIIKRFIKQRLGLEKSNYNSTIQMLKLMFKWTDDFEKNKKDFENKINKYNDKLIVLSKTNDVNEFKL